MKVERLAIPDVILVTPPKFGDSRGFFSETYNAARFAGTLAYDEAAGTKQAKLKRLLGG